MTQALMQTPFVQEQLNDPSSTGPYGLPTFGVAQPGSHANTSQIQSKNLQIIAGLGYAALNLIARYSPISKFMPGVAGFLRHNQSAVQVAGAFITPSGTVLDLGARAADKGVRLLSQMDWKTTWNEGLASFNRAGLNKLGLVAACFAGLGYALYRSQTFTHLPSVTGSFADQFTGAKHAGYYTKNQLNQAVNTGKIGLFTEQQVNEAVEQAKAGLFTEQQVNEAVEQAKAGLFTQDQVNDAVSEALSKQSHADSSSSEKKAGEQQKPKAN